MGKRPVLSWGDPSNNRAYAADVWLTANGVSLYFALKNDPAQRAIAEDTDHQALPFGVANSAPQTATMLNAMLFKHSKFPNGHQVLHPIHDGVGAIRPVADGVMCASVASGEATPQEVARRSRRYFRA